MKVNRTLILFTLLLLMGLDCASYGQAKEGALLETLSVKIHRQAWETIAQRTVTDPSSRASVYSTRSLMVHHPEIYLQVDGIWMDKIIARETAWIDEYACRDRLLASEEYWQQVERPIRRNIGKKVADKHWWDQIQWEHHRANAVPLTEIYQHYAAEMPVLEFFDHRLPFLYNALKGIEWVTPRLSLAEASYFHRRRKRANTTFLLITDAECGYIATLNKNTGKVEIYDPMIDAVVIKEQLVGDVYLVMNHKYVWHPLMGRDDTGKSADLKKVVSSLGLKKPSLSLDLFSKRTLTYLVEGTKLSSDRDKSLAMLAASRAVGQDSWLYPELRDIARPLFRKEIRQVNRGTYTMHEVATLGMILTEMGNRLSPATAYLAALVTINSKSYRQALETISDQYIKWFRNPRDPRFVYGSKPGIWEVTMEDKLISKLGGCKEEATNVAAVLALVNPDGQWRIWLTNWWEPDEGGHVITGFYSDGEDLTLSNGMFGRGDMATMHGPLWNIDDQVAYTILIKLDHGWLTTAQAAIQYPAIRRPFTNLSYDETVRLLQEVAKDEKHTSIWVGTYEQPVIMSIEEYLEYISQFEKNWRVFQW